MKSQIEFYILGLLRFNKEDKETIVLSNNELNIIQNGLSNLISDSPQNKIVDSTSHDLWKVWTIDNINKVFDKDVIDDINKALRKDITLEKCELGYYHHRIIFRLYLSKEVTQKELRNIREILHSGFRRFLNKLMDNLNNALSEASTKDPLRISFIYTYPLIIIQNGANLIKKEKDKCFSTSTTTFFFKIPEVKHCILIRSHFVRISIPSTIVYADGELKGLIFWELINDIYYAALYSKKMKDIKNASQGSNDLNEDILRKLSSYLIRDIVSIERLETGNRIAWFALILSITSIITLILTFII